MTTASENRELKNAILQSRKLLLHIGGFSFFVNLLMLTGPLYMLQVYDRVVTSRSLSTLAALTLLILVLYSALGLLEWVRTNLFNNAAARFEEVLSDRVLEIGFTESLSDSGKSSDRVLRELRTLRRFLSSSVMGAAFDLPWSPLFLLVLFLLHPLFGLCALLGAVILVFLGMAGQKASAPVLKEAEAYELKAQRRATELTNNAEVVDALGMHNVLRQQWRADFDRSDEALRQSAQVMAAFQFGTKAFRLFLQSGILGLGAVLAIQGQVTFGAMVAASILMGRAIAPIEQIVGSWRSIIVSMEGWKFLTALLKKHGIREEKMSLPPIEGELRVENVFVRMTGKEKTILRSVSFRLEPGDVLGVIGPSAAGKTTLARTLMGLVPVMSGHVRLDGADIQFFARDVLGRQVGYLPQRVDLLSGTVGQNIARFDPAVDAASVVAAAKLAGCHELILSLPDGYDTEIGLGGAYLSAGQRQRVGLARAVLGEPKFLVLDEPNSNLDTEGDLALQRAIEQLSKAGSTFVIVAHRPGTLVHCNKLLVLEGGEVKAFGPRNEILAKVMPKSGGTVVTPLRTGEAGN
jgi:PrtD family type I secretion system ABC transporter